MAQEKISSMEQLFTEVEQRSEDEKMSAMFRECYRNTLETTMKRLPDNTTYAVTGDIPAMWLRDSAAQIRPCLIQAKGDKELGDLIEGLAKRQIRYINIDCYANAYNEEPNNACWEKDDTGQKEQNPWVWERKFEIDSLCYPIQLSYLLWKYTGRTGHFDQEFSEAAKKILKVFTTEQEHEEQSDYIFRRFDTYFQDTLSRDGKGALVKSGIGLVWSGFRPSDDACMYGYLIPSNMFAVVILGYLEEIAEEVLSDLMLKTKAQALKEKIRDAIETYGITEKEGFGRIYAYEVDGFGQYNLMDDANVPSLLSMEYMGYRSSAQQVSENTRKFILSEANAYYYRGKKASGLGSAHTPAGYIWPIALAMEGLTGDREQKREILKILMDTTGGTGLMHEGFLADDDRKYTRPWFSWANAMFCELVLDYCGLTGKNAR